MRFLFVFIQFFMLLTVYGQNALDFKLTDTEGEKWHLFTELNLGKTVLLDFFYADCVPCQGLTPEIAKIYSDYGLDTGNVLVLGISDRDNNARIMQFDSLYGSNYPSGGIEGDGDSITLAYKTWFPFLAWPTYAVICPNGNIKWDLPKDLAGLPDIRAAIDTCILFTLIEDDKETSVEFKMFRNGFQLQNKNQAIWFRIFNLSGKLIYKELLAPTENLQHHDLPSLEKGFYIINFEWGEGSFSRSFIKT